MWGARVCIVHYVPVCVLCVSVYCVCVCTVEVRRQPQVLVRPYLLPSFRLGSFCGLSPHFILQTAWPMSIWETFLSPPPISGHALVGPVQESELGLSGLCSKQFTRRAIYLPGSLISFLKILFLRHGAVVPESSR